MGGNRFKNFHIDEARIRAGWELLISNRLLLDSKMRNIVVKYTKLLWYEGE